VNVTGSANLVLSAPNPPKSITVTLHLVDDSAAKEALAQIVLLQSVP
jgi:hypothetical protein